MALPKAVVEQVRRAEAEYAEAYPQNKPGVDESGSSQSGGNAQSPTAAPGTPPKSKETPTVIPDDQKDTSEEVVQSPDAATGTDAEHGEHKPVDYKQQYQTLKGKYDSEVPRLQQEVRSLQNQVDSYQDVMAALGDSTVDTSTQPTDIKIEDILTQEEIEEFGPELISVILKTAKGIASKEIEAVKKDSSKFKETLATVSENTKHTARERMIQYMDSELKNWKEINTDQRFLDWLNDVDVLSGKRKHELLQQAWEKNDGARVAMFFKQFVEQTTDSAGGNKEPAAQVQSEEEVQQATIEMDTLVAPGKPSSSEVKVSAQDGKRTFTEAEIAAFYADVRKGKYRSNPKERARIEKEIFAAAAENRISGGIPTV